LQYFENFFKKGCDPSKRHKKEVRSDLRCISLYYAKEAKKKKQISFWFLDRNYVVTVGNIYLEEMMILVTVLFSHKLI
jgi:formamidopyrimidine-DNA glycosylase